MEICVDSLRSAQNARLGETVRLEVCSALSEGGLTPSPGMIQQIKKFTNKPLRAMIRIRKGNFIYNDEEVEAMLHDIEVLKKYNVEGFVFGALDRKSHVDSGICLKIINAARPLPVTFHRAFDDVIDPIEALETIIDLGFDTILTSGQRDSALEGLGLLKTLVRKAAGRITIMPGGGINKDNLPMITRCGAKIYHASARKKEYVGPLRFNKDDFMEIANEYLVRELNAIVKRETLGER